VFLIIAPQNVIGASIIPLLEGMVEKAGDRPFIIFNPFLKVGPSASSLAKPCLAVTR
jgi:hypothetical protein